MQRTTHAKPRTSASTSQSPSLGQLVASLVALVVTLVVLWFGFMFLRSNRLPQLAIAFIAIIWGVGGVAALFYVANLVVESLSEKWRDRIRPYVFVGPAVAILAWFLFIPTLRTFYLSLFSSNSSTFVGLDNFVAVFANREMLQSFRNNLLWMIFGTGGSVSLGLLIAVLADRSKFETIAKSLIFMPMAISFVGAGIIWRFIYDYNPSGAGQVGVLNGLVVAFGGEPRAWLALVQPWNNLFLILVLIWMQTGFAMVIFSSAIKGIPDDIMEAARMDGATEVQIFFRIMIPYIMGTIITVTTTIVIFTLKIFDVVIVMTGGQYGTDVVATQFYRQFFTNRNFGYGSAVAIVLFIAVLPVMIYNLRQLRKQEAF
jgi:alpha-glucoside transport system permease protein